MEMMSTGLVNYLMGTGDFKAAFTNMELRIYSGTVPTTADAATSPAVVQVVVKNGGSYATFGSPTAGVLAINVSETWSGTVANTATVTFYRLVGHADDEASSTSECRVQGTIGVGGADMNVGTAALVASATFTVNTFTQQLVPN